LTPLEIEILLHYYYSSKDYPNLDAPLVKEIMDNFCKAGILIEWTNRTPRFYKNDDALELYVKTICAIPLPTQKWTIDVAAKI
jgi:hypothetical protein